MREFAVKLDAPVARGHRALRRRGRQPRLPARSDDDGCWSRSPSSARREDIDRLARRPRRRGRRRARGGARMSAINDNACTPTRDPGRRRRRPAARRAVRDADAARPRGDDLREVQGRPARVRRARARRPRAPRRAAARRSSAAPSRRSCPRSPSRRSCATTTGSRKRNFDLDTGLLPARLVHDEAQPEAARARRGAARQRAPAPGAGPRARPGRAAADVRAPAGAGRDRGPAARRRCSRAPARTASSPACC